MNVQTEPKLDFQWVGEVIFTEIVSMSIDRTYFNKTSPTDHGLDNLAGYIIYNSKFFVEEQAFTTKSRHCALICLCFWTTDLPMTIWMLSKQGYLCSNSMTAFFQTQSCLRHCSSYFYSCLHLEIVISKMTLVAKCM